MKRVPQLIISAHTETMQEVAEILHAQNHTGLAILYVASYCSKVKVTLQFIIEASAVEMNPQEYALIKKSLKTALKHRVSKNKAVSVYSDLIEQCHELMAQKDCSVQRKTICKILLASPFLCAEKKVPETAENVVNEKNTQITTKGEKEKKSTGFFGQIKAFLGALDTQTIVLVSMIGGITILLVTALIVLVVALGSNNAKDTDKTEKNSVTTTAKTDKAADGTTTASENKGGEDDPGAGA